MDGLSVGVITACYQSGRYISQALESVRKQSYPLLHHYVVDGGSTDGTCELLSRYPELVWISEPDRGQADAMNKGIAMAKEEIIGFLDADDLYAPGCVEHVAEWFENHPETRVVYGDFATIDRDSRILKAYRARPFVARDLVRRAGGPTAQLAVFVRRAVLEQVGGLNPSLHYGLDFDLWLRIALRGYPIHYIPRILGYHRFHSENKSLNMHQARTERKSITRMVPSFGLQDRLWMAWYDFRHFAYLIKTTIRPWSTQKGRHPVPDSFEGS